MRPAHTDPLGVVIAREQTMAETKMKNTNAHHGKLIFPVLLDRRANIAERFGVVSLPVTFFIDQDGIIRERVVGGTLTEDGIEEIFKRVQTKQGPG